jgi:hypothetical protein
MLVGEKTAVIPVGNSDIAKATAELNVELAEVVSVIFAGLPPPTTLVDVKDACRVYVAGMDTAKLTGRVFVTPPPVAVTVRVYLPAIALDAAVAVSITVLLGLRVAAERLAVTPAGAPLTLRFTVAVKPYRAAILICAPADGLVVAVSALMDEASVNVGGGCTTRLIRTVLVAPAPTPVTVML